VTGGYPKLLDQEHLSDIRSCIEAELNACSQPLAFVVESCTRLEDVWQITIKEGDTSKSGLDEALEGNRAWWIHPARGAADVLSVAPEQLQINLRFATTTPPGEGQTLFVYPPQYLEALKRAWDDHMWAHECLARMNHAVNANEFHSAQASDPRLFPSLRQRQREAFALTGWRCGFLWGPPGTGKTYTLGALLATFLLDRSSARIPACASNRECHS
jgi:hypothetical protein